MIESLYAEYFDQRFETLTLDQFETFVIYTPPLMVVACDQVVDKDEEGYVRYYAEFLARTFKNSIPDEEKRKEFQFHLEAEMFFLLKYMSDWEGQFLEGVSFLLDEEPSLKSVIQELLTLFAESSDGISTPERKKIQEINAYLQTEKKLE
ncbi:MAG: hypothetical protein ACFCUI_04475 [Bernardetiaceae bacterium]